MRSNLRLAPPLLLLTLSLSHSLLALFPDSVGATENATAAADLSWSATSPAQKSLASPGPSATLYLHVRGVTSFKGGEFDLKWSPAGEEGSACLVHETTSFRTSQGTTCTYLNRGTVLPITVADTVGEFHVAWSCATALQSCGAGVIVTIGFDLSECTSSAATFSLCDLRLLDAVNAVAVVAAESLGAAATIAGGGSSPPDCTGGSSGGYFFLAAVPPQSVAVGMPLAVDPQVLGAPVGLVAWSGANLPNGATVDPSTGRFLWQADSTLRTIDSVTVTGTDSTGHEESVQFSITVDPMSDTHFGVFQAAAASLPTQRLVDAHTQWLHRTLFPLKDGWQATIDLADATVDNVFGTPIEVVFDVSCATGADLNAHWPPTGTDPNGVSIDSVLWFTRITNLAKRYNMNVAGHYAGLTHTVNWWHIEEEASFWMPGEDPCGCTYERMFIQTRAALVRGNPNAHVALMGLSSDPTWAAANVNGFTDVLAISTDGHAFDTSIDTNPAFQKFQDRARNWLSLTPGGGPDCATDPTGRSCINWTWLNPYNQAPGYGGGYWWYDAADMHAYERAPMIGAKSAWARDKMTTVKQQLWLFELGAPYFAGASFTKHSGDAYTLATHSQAVFSAFGEAFANRVERAAWEFYPPGAGNSSFDDQAYHNVALYHDPAPYSATYASQSYPQAVDLIGGYTSAYEVRIPMASRPAWVCTSPLDHCNATQSPCSCVEWLRDFVIHDACYFYPSGSSVRQASVLWSPDTTLAVQLWVGSGSSGAPLDLYYPSYSTTSSGSHVTIGAGNPVSLTLGPEPVIVRCGDVFSVTDPLQTTTSVGGIASGTRKPSLFASGQRSGTWTLRWANLGTPAPTTLVVVDARGRVVRRIRVIALPGTGEMRLAASPSEQPIAAGIYFARVLDASGSALASARAVVLP